MFFTNSQMGFACHLNCQLVRSSVTPYISHSLGYNKITEVFEHTNLYTLTEGPVTSKPVPALVRLFIMAPNGITK